MGRHRDVRLEQVIGLLDRIGGKAGLGMLLRSSSPVESGLCGPKYGDLTLGEIEAVFNLLVQTGGLGVLEKMRNNEVVVRFDGATGGIKQKKTVGLYDRFGRIIPPRNLSDRPVDANRLCKFAFSDAREWHTFDLASLNLVDRFDRIRPFLPSDCGITLPTREEIIQSLIHCEAIRDRLRNDKASKNILRGAHLPTILPKCAVSDHGELLEILFTIAKSSFEVQFPGRKFQNYLEGRLVGKVLIIPESRFEMIRNQMTAEFVSGNTFFTPFQGYSALASRQTIDFLPEECALSCFDSIWNWALYPDILLSNGHTPGFDLAGFFWGSSSYSLYGWAHDDVACLYGGGLSTNADFSAGLFLSR